MPDVLHIPLSQEETSFASHLEKQQRIFFSGRFGTGKTHFLDHFFKSKDNYCVIRLSPVHYSVAQNTDIFELIKVDVLLQLLAHEGVEVEKDENIQKSIAFYGTLQRFGSFAMPIMEITSIAGLAYKFQSGDTDGEDIAKIATGFSKAFDKLNGLLERLKEADQPKESKTTKTFKDYAEEFFQKKGSPLENDLITMLIRDCIAQLNEAENGKSEKLETVLWIDDLDRIDPAHIFRILNVLSVHTDDYLFTKETANNKFGFSKIILTGDIENIRHIFHHQYGTSTDFNGYVDKFYDGEVFRFDPVNAIVDWLEIKIGKGAKIENSPWLFRSDVRIILSTFLEYNLIGIRQILKGINEVGIGEGIDFAPPLKTEYFRINDASFFYYTAKLLKRIFGDKEALLKASEKLVLRTESELIEDKKFILFGNLLPVLIRSSSNISKMEIQDAVYSLSFRHKTEAPDVNWNFRFVHGKKALGGEVKKSKDNNGSEKTILLHLWKLFYEALKQLEREGVI